MKQLLPTLTLFLLVSLLFSSCKKDKAEPIDQLPPATQEGKNTFGCLVNGEAFIPKGSIFSGPNTECYYQYVREGFHFHVSGEDRSRSDNVLGININTDSLKIEEGTVINLTKGYRGEASGAYTDGSVFNEYRTDYRYKGELKITRFDEEQQIVSGTFWFDAVNDMGEKVEVRKGRFDMLYHR